MHLSNLSIENRWLRKGRSPVVFAAIGLLSIALCTPAIAQEKLTRVLTVRGVGNESIPTTLTQVQLGVEVKGKTTQGVQQEVARRSSAVVELLRSRQVEKLQTAGIQLQPSYDYSDNQQRLTGYIGTNIVSFRLANDRLGNLLDESVRVGATRIDSISFVASDSAIAQAQKEALKSATQDAQQQADAVLSSLNLTRKEVVGIQINEANNQPPSPVVYRSDEAMSKAPETPVVGGEQTVNATVTLQISY